MVASFAGWVASRFAHGTVSVPGHGASLAIAFGSRRAARPRLAGAARVEPLCGACISPFVAAAPGGSWLRGIVAGLCARSRPRDAFGALSFNALPPFAQLPVALTRGFALLASSLAEGFRFGHLTPRCSGPQGWPAASPVAAELER